jgi:ADP-ribosylglycohydrolase
MLGAIVGDIIGSPYEFDCNNIKTTDFPLFTTKSQFTDDTILTVATAQVLLDGLEYAVAYRAAYLEYPYAGWSTGFTAWARSGSEKPYNSFGNGAAMRVSPIGWAFATMEETLSEAKRSADASHNHLEGIKGAQATAAAVYLARTGASKPVIKNFIQRAFGYDLSRTLDEIRPSYHHVESCQETVPEAITAFLESDSFEDAIRKAVSLGGDSDTLTCITGGIAEAFYSGVPEPLSTEALARLDAPLQRVVERFRERYM